MEEEKKNTGICQICRVEKDKRELMSAEYIRDTIIETIKKAYPDWHEKGFICLDDLNRFRSQHIQDALEEEKGELTTLEQDVVKSLQEQELLSKNINSQFDRTLSIGDRIADKVAEFGGSWKFIITFGIIIFVWITFNSLELLFRPFDPFPFILLNLVLSCLAAMQAPVIMMSQNRQEAKDRVRGEHDYKVNLKAELEIRHINEKIDHLLIHQWQKLMDVQQIQMEMMEEILRKNKKENE